jgi:hypothetical protein
MKKTMLAFLLIASIVMLSALESDPSDVVGFVKYEMLTGLNFIALPMDAGYATSADVGNGITDANQMSYWNETSQIWVSSNKNMFGNWVSPFAVEGGMPLMARTTSASDFYVAGSMFDPEPTYDLVVGLNTIMVPLSKTTLTTSALVGNDLGSVDQMSYYNSTSQLWVSSNKNMFGNWVSPFATDIAMPLMTRATATFTWPTPPPAKASNPGFTNLKNNIRK